MKLLFYVLTLCFLFSVSHSFVEVHKNVKEHQHKEPRKKSNENNNGNSNEDRYYGADWDKMDEDLAKSLGEESHDNGKPQTKKQR